jgi:uncharacterized protein (TIGR02001 family)
MKNLSLATLLALSTLTSVSALHANEVELSGNIGVASHYVWRGMSQSDDNIAISGGADLGYNGFYVGTWASSVDFGTGYEANYELDLYAGYGNFIGDFSYDISYIAYLYPDSASNDEINFSEVALAVGYDIGKVSLGASIAKTVYEEWDNGTDPIYAQATAAYDFDIASVGVSYGDYEDIGTNYTASVSKSLDIKGQAFDVALVYSNYNDDASSTDDQDHVFATITYSF